MEKTNLPNVSFPVLLTYKNISSSNFLIYTFTKDEQQAIQKQFEDVKGRSLTLDEFNSFLYNLELFEGKILNLRKKR